MNNEIQDREYPNGISKIITTSLNCSIGSFNNCRQSLNGVDGILIMIFRIKYFINIHKHLSVFVKTIRYINYVQIGNSSVCYIISLIKIMILICDMRNIIIAISVIYSPDLPHCLLNQVHMQYAYKYCEDHPLLHQSSRHKNCSYSKFLGEHEVNIFN